MKTSSNDCCSRSKFFLVRVCPLRELRQIENGRVATFESVPIYPKFRFRERMNGWMTCDFTSFSTAFQSYQDDGRVIMKGCVHWNPWEDFASSGTRSRDR